MENYKKYTESNRDAWNLALTKHRLVMDKKWDSFFEDKNFISQKGVELDQLKKMGIKGKNIAHLCCNNGVELLSLKRLKAAKCIGFDICDEAIKDGKKRAEKFGIDCQFVRTDVYEIDKKYDNSFDIVYITVGALIWLPDKELFFKKVSSLLKENGKLFIYEHHPFGDIFPYDDEEDDKLKAKYSYFNDQIYEDDQGIDYYGGTTYKSPKSYEFSYTISDLINKIIKNGLKIERFNEYKKDIALGHQKLEKMDKNIPLSYILIAEK